MLFFGFVVFSFLFTTLHPFSNSTSFLDGNTYFFTFFLFSTDPLLFIATAFYTVYRDGIYHFYLSTAYFLCLWASWLWILTCYFIVPAIALPLLYFLLHVGLWADAPAVSTQFSRLYLFWALLANILVVPAHFITWASSAHLLLLFYFFYSHGPFAKSFGLPQPSYHILTSYYFFKLICL